MEAKGQLRARLLAARADRDPAARRAAGAALAVHGVAAAAGAKAVLGYAAVGDEPPTRPLLEALTDADVDIWLPAVHGRDLRWGRYVGWDGLRPAAFGLLEPAGAQARPPSVEVAFVPALAVDRRGNRLGRGRGYYDRALGQMSVRAIAVVYDEEVLDEVPTDTGDVAVDAVLTPSGLVQLR